MAGGQAGSPAGDRQKSHVDAAQSTHPLEEVGIACEVHRPRARDHIADGLGPARAHAEPGGMLGVGNPHS